MKLFHNLAEDIAFLLIKHKIADIEQRDTYIYVFEVILLNGSLLIVFLIISLLCGEMINFWSYLIFFLPLRIFSAGYHEKTNERCFVLSTIMYVSTIIAAKLLPLLYQDWYWRIAGVISILVILVLTPLINKNNPLKKSNKKYNRIIVYLLLTVDFVFFILCCNYNWKIASNELIFIILNAFLLLAGKTSTHISED